MFLMFQSDKSGYDLDFINPASHIFLHYCMHNSTNC
uniref:Uncharacterized protein n=1 Tax=Anguilla anguilla TaxID=7936 RepID=A0A0E9R7Y8_ANGAN